MQTSLVAPETRSAAAAPMRRINIGSNAATVERRSDGAILVRPTRPLGAYPVKLTERLARFALEAPQRIFLAERDADGAWRKITYAQAFHAAKAIGSALIRRGLSPGASADDPFRQRHRACAAGARVSACRPTLRADLARLFDRLERFLEARPYCAASDARSGVRERRRCLRGGAGGCRRGGAEEIVVARLPPPGRRAASVFRNCWRPPLTMNSSPAPMTQSAATRSPRFSSPRGRPPCPRASSTRRRCGPPTSR